MHKPVDNHHWGANNYFCPVDIVWIKKKLKMNCGRALRDTNGGSRNCFTAGNGHQLRATSENVEWAGKPVHRTGVWPRRAAHSTGEAGELADPGRRPGQGPLHLIRGGDLVALCPTEGVSPARHAGQRERDGQPPIIDLASKAGKPRNSRITSATRCMRTASTGPTG